MTIVECGFCGAHNPALRYPTRSHTSAQQTGIDLGGGIWACQRCATHIDNDTYEQLLPHVTIRQRAGTGPLPTATIAAPPERRAQLLIALFRSQRTGTPTTYTRGKATP